MPSTPPLDAKPTGRPRSAEADQAILRAALELCAAHGLEGATVEAVAARAGVGKATVYRRYPNRVGLVVAAATGVCSDLVDDVDTGSVVEDLTLIAHGMVRTLRSELTRTVLAQVAAAASRHSEMRAAQRQFVASRRAITTRAIRRGIERGELRRDADPELLADLVAAPIFHRAVTLGEPVSNGYAEAVVGVAVRAFAA